MFGRLLLMFLVIPLAELALLMRFAEATSIPVAIGVVILTGICGSLLAARQGAQAIRNFQTAVAQGRAPGTEVVDGLLIVFAAALLLTPGLLTDGIGILLLIPVTRAFMRRWLIRHYAGRFEVQTFGRGGLEPEQDSPVSSQHGKTIDAPFHSTRQK